MSRIAITGVSGYLGSRLLAALDSEPAVESIVGIDIRLPQRQSPKLTFIQQDITAPLDDTLRRHGVTTMFHLAFLLNPLHDRARARRINVGGTASVLQACKAAGVAHITFTSSSTVYGAHPDNPAPLTEASPLRPNKGMAYAEDKAETDHMMQSFAGENPQTVVAILRGSPVLGADADNFVARGLFRSALYKVAGRDPLLQYTHQKDMAALLLYCLRQRMGGIYNVASEGALRYSDLGRLAGKRVISFPPGFLEIMAELSWRARLQGDGNSAGVAFIKYPWIVSTEAVKSAGFQFSYSAADAVQDFAQGWLRRARKAGGG